MNILTEPRYRPLFEDDPDAWEDWPEDETDNGLLDGEFDGEDLDDDRRQATKGGDR